MPSPDDTPPHHHAVSGVPLLEPALPSTPLRAQAR